MSAGRTFKGWVAEDKSAAEGNMQWKDFEVKPFEDDDVDIEIAACGICGSDVHTLSSGWGATPYPIVVGHEIVGKAIRVGKNVKHITEGQRVGVGAQSGSCLKPDCEECNDDLENHCSEMIQTFGSKYPDGSQSAGGFAENARVPSHFVIPIPDAIATEDAAPMLCGGITVYSPLKKNGCGPGKKVGIIGLGGLGHFGVLFAKALGADKVVAVSRKTEKREDALKLGADQYIATDDDEDWAKNNARSLDLIVCTVNSAKMPIDGYLSLLRPRGTFVQVGAPEDKLPAMSAFDLIFNGISFKGSLIGSPAEIREMLDFVAERKIKPWIQKYPMKEANQAVIDFNAGKPRYRISLIN